jgi:aminoglycoside 6'-N-acetyltransferase
MKLILRPATFDDIPLLQAWDREPDVMDASGNDADSHDWLHELGMQSDVYRYYVAELDGRPIGAMQIIDPHLEPTHYWGEIEPNLRALDIWIGDESDRGRGHGERMMKLALGQCFANPRVTAVVIDPLHTNLRALKFYRRLGFKDVGRRLFGDDDCLVQRLERADWQRA